MTTQPTPLPPTVAELRALIIVDLKHPVALRSLDELCRRAADPAPVADEAAIESWDKRMASALDQAAIAMTAHGRECVHSLGVSLKAEAVRLMRAAPRNDDGRLRKLREEMQAEWLECIENKKQFPVGSGDRRECQAEANAFQSACFRIDRLLAESPAGDAVGLFGDDKLRSEIAAKWGHAGAHVEVFDDLRARLQATEADLAAAKSIYREHWDDCDTVAEMMRSACNEAVLRLRQFKDRGGIIDKLEADLAAAQKERDVAVTGARDFRAAWEREKRWREDDRAAAKAEGARAVVEIPQEIVEWAELWAKGPQADNWPCRTAKWILSLRAAQPQPTKPATVRQGDEVLRAYVNDYQKPEVRKESFTPGCMDEALAELCRRALEGKP